MLPYRDTVMPLYHSKETYPEKPNNVYGGPNWQEYSLGLVRWSVRSDTFGRHQCMVLHADGLYTPQTSFRFNQFKKVTVENPMRGVIEWWVDADGTILRQFQSVTDTRGKRTATCSYDKDSINVQFDNFGRRSAMTLYPAEMDKVQAQFKPMVANGHILMRDKEFLVYDPFSGGFQRRKAHVEGHFDGSYLSIKFHGVLVSMDGLVAAGPAKVYVDDENDLVQIDLPNDCYVKLGVPPPGKENAKR
jgi:hypothetical protein